MLVFSAAKTIAVAICVTVFLLPVCINCTIYFMLCYSTLERSKEIMQEPLRKDNLELNQVISKNSIY